MDHHAMGQPDEGYCEPPPEGIQAKLQQIMAAPDNFYPNLADLSMERKHEIISKILSSMSTSEVARLFNIHISPRLHVDFVRYLPAELVLKILSYLPVHSLLQFGFTCHAWYIISLDSGLWKDLYYDEGWLIDESYLKHMETLANSSRLNSGMIDIKFSSRPGVIDNDDVCMQDNPADSYTPNNGSYTMCPDDPEKVLTHYINALTRPKNHSQISTTELFIFGGHNDSFKINWKYIFIQRQRLEKNWDYGKYTNFTFPNPEHPEESHTECVYTLQFNNDYLVSGGRDRTIRIWDINTQRLIRKPLEGHQGSVLCVQFDPSPESDIIISGSSDFNVIVWKFSTGEMVKLLDRAHRDSVLNLRFDKNVLVTCSKDNTIRVFNRRPLKFGDPGYVLNNPHELQDAPAMIVQYGYDLTAEKFPIRPAFETLCILKGHAAPVNALQIHGSEIVSASGDRLIKLWNWEKAACTRTVQGHSKGIACVQYDGRRIVSGSSDNEIKIFDSKTGAIVASLRSHTALVRTIQAGFADVATSVEDDEAAAKLADHEFDKAVAEGHIGDPSRPQSRTVRPSIPGSSRPEELLSRGAKLPPGGGGGTHARIVSGSYDQSVAVWRRRKKDGRDRIWEVNLQLLQQDAVLKTHLRDAYRRGRTYPLPPRSVAEWSKWIQEHMMTIESMLNVLVQCPVMLCMESLLHNAIDHSTTPPLRTELRDLIEHMKIEFKAAIRRWEKLKADPMTIPSPTPGLNNLYHFTLNNPPPLTLSQLGNRIDYQSARIFKLQYDATRIIACTHKSTIVGWDFCNDDPAIKILQKAFMPIR